VPPREHAPYLRPVLRPQAGPEALGVRDRPDAVATPEPALAFPVPTPQPQASRPAPTLTLRGVDVFFGGVHALEHVDFDVYPREVVALVGENAAGKSVLAKVLAGVYQPTAGQIAIDGAPVTIPNPTAAQRLGIATVFQDLALANNLDVAANLFLGRELRTGGVMRRAEMEILAREKLAEIGARIPSVRLPVSTLSGGQRQSVAIARAMLGQPRIVVLDEPTASLSITQTAEVLDVIQRMRELGCGVVLISHNLADVQAVADRVVVLRHGRNNGDAPVSQVTYEDIVAAITGAACTLPTPAPQLVRRVVGS